MTSGISTSILPGSVFFPLMVALFTNKRKKKKKKNMKTTATLSNLPLLPLNRIHHLRLTRTTRKKFFTTLYILDIKIFNISNLSREEKSFTLRGSSCTYGDPGTAWPAKQKSGDDVHQQNRKAIHPEAYSIFFKEAALPRLNNESHLPMDEREAFSVS